jgi:hypothetical protein
MGYLGLDRYSVELLYKVMNGPSLQIVTNPPRSFNKLGRTS